MIRRVTLDVDESVFPWITGFIAMAEHALGVALKVTIREMNEAGTVETRLDRSTVKYAVTGGREALTALGEGTIIGILFAHLYDHGPMTMKELAVAKPYNKKTIEASLWRLRHQGLIESQENG